MTPDELKNRTKKFGGEIIKFARTLPLDDASRIMSKQLIRCATSVGANYRAACLAKSTADMIVKLKFVEEEADESKYWLELLDETETAPKAKIAPFHREADEILKIMSASIVTLKGQRKL